MLRGLPEAVSFGTIHSQLERLSLTKSLAFKDFSESCMLKIAMDLRLPIAHLPGESGDPQGQLLVYG